MQKKGESQRIDVVGVGENSIDLVASVPRHPLPDEKLELLDVQSLPGGQVASALVACARQGCATRYVGTFGNDDHARTVESALQREGVDTTRCRRARAANRAALILVDAAAGTRTVLWRRDNALLWPAAEMTADLVAGSRVLLVDATDLDASVAAAGHARAAGVTVIADLDEVRPGIEALLRLVDIAITSETFPQALTGASTLGQAVRALHAECRPALVVTTLGADGAVSWDGALETWSPGFVVPVVDPTGAGDGFRGGFVSAWLAGAGTGGRLADVLEWANATAALGCRAVGAQTGLPTRAEVQALVTGRAVSRSNRHGSARRRRR